MGLAFEISIRARPADLIGPLLEERLAQHMEAKGLELREVEGLAVLPEAVLDVRTFDHAWKFMTPTYAPRKGSEGAILHSQMDPHSSRVTVNDMNRMAKRIATPAPPNADKAIIIVGAPLCYLL